MMDERSIHAYVSSMPWPPGKRPIVKFGFTERGYQVLLHETIANGWTDVASIEAMVPETALRHALSTWMTLKGLNNDPRLFDALRRLQC